jgi:hypothetical protein
MPPTPKTPEYWDAWHANQAETPTVGEVMNRHLGLPPDLQAGIVPAVAIQIRRVLKPGGRVALTCWEPVDRDDERVPVRRSLELVTLIRRVLAVATVPLG